MLNSNSICVGVRSSGFPKNQSHQVINLIQMWLRKSGPEWTTNRLKSLKTWYIQSLSGVETQRPDWVRFNNRGYPSGPLSMIFRCKKPQKVISALMAYSGITLKRVSPGQWSKFYTSLSKEPLTSDQSLTEGWGKVWKEICPDTFISDIKWEDESYTIQRSDFDHVKISDLLGKRVRIPIFDQNCNRTTGISEEEVLKGTGHPLAGWYLRRAWQYAPPHIRNLVITQNTKVPVEEWDSFHVGRIGFIQEPGCKLRAVANPLPIFQILLSRLGRNLYHQLRMIRNDCTFDQEKGLELISRQLEAGNKLHSLDLSDATNNFPLGLTVAFLFDRSPYIDSSLDWKLFVKLSRASWSAPQNPSGCNSVKWTVGQPLGLYPSFAAFALSHHTVLKEIISRDHLQGDDAFYVILGDDLVCSDKLGISLREVYNRLSVPISESKSLTSDKLSEFAGRLVLCTDTKTSILIQPKYRRISDKSFLQLRRNLGRGITPFLLPRQRKVVFFLERVLPDHHPLGLMKWRDLHSSKEYIQSESLAEALSCDKLVTRRSPLSEDLRDVKDMILVENARKVPDIVQEPTSNQVLPGTSEELLLENVGILHADFPESTPSSWSVDQDIGGDPRGPSSLEVMEDKIRRIDMDRTISRIDQLHLESQRLLKELNEFKNSSSPKTDECESPRESHDDTSMDAEVITPYRRT